MGFYFSISGLIFVLIIAFDFFSKRRVNNIETIIYKYLLFVTIILLSLDVLTALLYNLGIDYNNLLYMITSKTVFVSIVLWLMVFSFYIKAIGVSEKNRSKSLNKLFYILLFIFIIITPFLIILPVIFTKQNGNIVPNGYGVNLAYICSFALFVYDIVLAIKYRKNLSFTKLRPLFVLVILLLLDFALQAFVPDAFLINFIIALVVIIMYYTIENPDVKMIEQLNIAREQAERANHAKTDFLSSMSHEIRTPLNAIDGFSQLILEEEDIKVIKDEARDIMAASQNLLEIVNGILDISKIEANKLEIVKVEYEPAKIFDELVKLTKSRIGEKPLDFKVKIAKDLPEYLNGDYVRLKQIVLNLLTNAVKYTKTGSIELNVSIVRKERVCRLIISVKDTGIGIKKENIDKLFTKFERFDLDKNLTIEGTGLGLAITKKLVDLMNGKIVVDSVYGKGSNFTVAIDQRIVNKVKTAEVKIEEDNSKKINIKGKKILIVDDNLINLKVAARLLSTYKVETEEVSSGFDCIKKIEDGNKYDLILMDDMMPKMSGVETFKKLQKMEGFNIPVIALTANAIAGMKENYLNLGFNDYISKPIDKKELERVLKTYLK